MSNPKFLKLPSLVRVKKPSMLLTPKQPFLRHGLLKVKSTLVAVRIPSIRQAWTWWPLFNSVTCEILQVILNFISSEILIASLNNLNSISSEIFNASYSKSSSLWNIITYALQLFCWSYTNLLCFIYFRISKTYRYLLQV